MFYICPAKRTFCLSIAFGLTFLLTIPPVFSAAPAGKAPMSDSKVKKALEPIDKTLTDLYSKVQSHYLFGPKDNDDLTQTESQLQDLMITATANPLLVRNLYQTGVILSRRDSYLEAYDFLTYLVTNYPDNPFALRAKIEIAQMKKRVGEQFFNEAIGASSAAASKS